MKKTKAIILALIISFSGTTAFGASVAELMSTAFEPVGKCLYVYGGGWNEADTMAGTEALSYGISDRWTQFFNQNTSAYNYKTTRYQIHDGLDCTGYVGWSMYQMFGTSFSPTGYVYPSGRMADEYAKLFSSAVIPKNKIMGYECGDIMCCDGHVYMVLGQCPDKSVVFLHASPPNVSLCGTYTPDGRADSEAVRLAEKYMKEYFGECYAKYPRCSRGTSYLTSYDQLRWNADILPDTDGYRQMSADMILEDIFKNIKIYINDTRLYTSSEAEYQGDSIYIPVRDISESLNAQVLWDNAERKAIIKKGDNTVCLYVDSGKVSVNGKIREGMVTYLKNDLTYAPVRLVSETMGAKVDWVQNRKAVKIYG